MPLSMLTVTGGTNGWVKSDGTIPAGDIVLQPVQSVTGGGYIVVAAPVTFQLVNGNISGQIANTGLVPGLQYMVWEQITGAENPNPYVVTPTGSTLDLSTAPRSTSGAVLTFLLASTVGQPNGIASLDGTGNVPSTELANALPYVVKRVTLTFGSPNQGPNNGFGATQTNTRALNMVQATPFRYRFKISNANAQNGTNPATPVTVNSLWIGKPLYGDASHNLKWLGDLTATPVQVYTGPGAVPTVGTTDLVTPWVTNGGEISAHTPFVLSVGITTPGGGSGICMADCYGGIQYGAASSGQAGVAVPAGGYNYAGFILDIRMEYEFAALPTDLVAFVAGASGDSGYSPNGDQSGSPRALNDPVDAWPAVWSARQAVHAINGGLFGSATTDWLSLTGRAYARFDLSTTVPDVAIVGTMASNDISLGTSTATIIANHQTIVANLRTLGIRRVFAATIPPRSGLTGGQETVREAVNAYLRAIPDGIEDVFDFDLALRDPAARTTMLSDFASSDGVHPLRIGYRRIAEVPRIDSAGP